MAIWPRVSGFGVQVFTVEPNCLLYDALIAVAATVPLADPRLLLSIFIQAKEPQKYGGLRSNELIRGNDSLARPSISATSIS